MDLTQKELAKKVGISRQGLRLIETGKSNPKLSTCKKICVVLNKTLDEIFLNVEKDKTRREEVLFLLRENSKNEFKIANNIYYERRKIDLTQKELANKAGISIQGLRLIEYSKSNPKLKTCKKICNGLNKTLDEVFGFVEEDEILDEKTVRILSENIKRVGEYIRNPFDLKQ